MVLGALFLLLLNVLVVWGADIPSPLSFDDDPGTFGRQMEESRQLPQDFVTPPSMPDTSSQPAAKDERALFGLDPFLTSDSLSPMLQLLAMQQFMLPSTFLFPPALMQFPPQPYPPMMQYPPQPYPPMPQPYPLPPPMMQPYPQPPYQAPPPMQQPYQPPMQQPYQPPMQQPYQPPPPMQQPYQPPPPTQQPYQPPPPTQQPYQPPPPTQQPYQPPPPTQQPYQPPAPTQQPYQPPPPTQQPYQAPAPMQQPYQLPPQQPYQPPPTTQKPYQPPPPTQQPYQPPPTQTPYQPPLPTQQPYQMYSQQPYQPMQQQYQSPPTPQSYYPVAPQQPYQAPPPTQQPYFQMPPQPPQPPQQPYQPPRQPDQASQVAQQVSEPRQMNDDLFGRGKIPPSQVDRFAKYFVSAGVATAALNPVVAPTPGVVPQPLPAPASQPAAPAPAVAPPVMVQPVQNAPPAPATPKPTASPTLPSFTGLGGLNFGGLSSLVSGFPTAEDFVVSDKKCDTKVNFNFGGNNYLASFLTPLCPNLTWSDAADFCQSRGLTLVSPGSKDNTDAIIKLGSMMKNAGGFWTDGYVAHPTSTKVQNTVMWTSLDMNPAGIVPGSGLFSTTGDDGRPQPDNFLFRQSGRVEDVEHCVALFNGRNKDGVKLHDQACQVRLPAVCQVVPTSAFSLSGLITQPLKLNR